MAEKGVQGVEKAKLGRKGMKLFYGFSRIVF